MKESVRKQIWDSVIQTTLLRWTANKQVENCTQRVQHKPLEFNRIMRLTNRRFHTLVNNYTQVGRGLIIGACILTRQWRCLDCLLPSLCEQTALLDAVVICVGSHGECTELGVDKIRRFRDCF